MNKQQILLVAIAIAATAGLYFFGPTVAPTVAATTPKADTTSHEGHNHAEGEGHDHDHAAMEIAGYQASMIEKLDTVRKVFIKKLLTTADNINGSAADKEEALHANHRLAAFWKDSVPDPALHFYFVSRGAELENTEKSLTFAAHSILAYLPFAQSQQEQSWLAGKGKELFESALKINPSNDSSIVGAGGCIIYGASAGQEGPMQGILKVRAVAEKDSTNMFAQYMLGVGGMMSQQYDKAILRFEKVAKAQPTNMEVLFKLAETNEILGDKPGAIKWYNVILAQVKDPQMKAELQKRINELKG